MFLHYLFDKKPLGRNFLEKGNHSILGNYTYVWRKTLSIRYGNIPTLPDSCLLTLSSRLYIVLLGLSQCSLKFNLKLLLFEIIEPSKYSTCRYARICFKSAIVLCRRLSFRNYDRFFFLMSALSLHFWQYDCSLLRQFCKPKLDYDIKTKSSAYRRLVVV